MHQANSQAFLEPEPGAFRPSRSLLRLQDSTFFMQSASTHDWKDVWVGKEGPARLINPLCRHLSLCFAHLFPELARLHRSFFQHSALSFKEFRGFSST